MFTITISNIEGSEAGLWRLQVTSSYGLTLCVDEAPWAPFQPLVQGPSLAGFIPLCPSHLSLWKEQEQCFLVVRSIGREKPET